MALIAAHLPLPPPPYPLPPFSPSLISLMFSVDVKHHVYLLIRVFLQQPLLPLLLLPLPQPKKLLLLLEVVMVVLIASI